MKNPKHSEWMKKYRTYTPSRAGTTNTEEHKRKISASLLEYYRKNKKPPVSDETRKKMSLASLKNPRRYWLGKKRPDFSASQVGEKNHQWKGGITDIGRKIRNSPEYKEWRRQIRDRDKVCVLCQGSDRLQADHIKASAMFPELRFEISNGRLLCFECHKKTDNYGGRARRKSME